jgi:hypothetical protein
MAEKTIGWRIGTMLSLFTARGSWNWKESECQPQEHDLRLTNKKDFLCFFTKSL